MPEISYIYFTLFGDFDPEDIAPHISLKPWQSYMKHSRSEEKRLPRVSRLNYALIESSSECPDIYELSEQLVDILEPHKSELTFVTANYKIEASCSICLWISHSLAVSAPAIGFSRRVTQFLASVNASIDVDSYRDWDDQEDGEQAASSNH